MKAYLVTEEFLVSQFTGEKGEDLRSPSDRITVGERVKAWRTIQALHEYNRARHDDPDDPFTLPPLRHGIYIVAGKMGRGKTTAMSLFAALVYGQGYLVFHNSSLLFGYRFDNMVDLYLFSRNMPNNCALFIDEAHTFANRFNTNTTRQQMFQQALAGLRKNSTPIYMGSAQAFELPGNLKWIVDYVVYPMPRKLRTGWGTKASPDRWTLPYPRWCWNTLKMLGPEPYRGKDIGEEYGIPMYDEDVGVVTKHVSPAHWYEAAKLQHSYERVKVGESFAISSKDIKSEFASDRPGAPGLFDFGMGIDDDPENGDTQGERDAKVLNHVRRLFLHQLLDITLPQHSWTFVWEQFQALRPGQPDVMEEEARGVLRRNANMAGTLATAQFGKLWLDWDDLTKLANQGLLDKLWGSGGNETAGNEEGSIGD